MMKFFGFLVISMLLVVSFTLFGNGKSPSPKNQQTKPVLSPTAVPVQKQHTSIFVPYWSVGSGMIDTKEYDSVIYFGIAPTQTGINKQDAGYLQLEEFVQQTDGQETFLTVRMLDNDINFAVLKDTVKQEKVIAETVTLAKEYGFEGIVLDLELSSLPFESVIQQINSFTQKYSQAAHEEEMQFNMAIYGDTFYRIRPFEVQTLEKSVDQVMIMAYDLHKANGNPGPNFPLRGNEKYGYDYTKLIDQFLTFVPADRITVVFGLFGYDWPVGEKDVAISIGKAKSMLEVERQIVDNCSMLQCTIIKDEPSAETKVRYIDSDNKPHIVWYEDVQSAIKKQEYLQKRGVTNFSYWAYSYF